MARWGGGVPWWRVVRVSGMPATGHEREALRRLRAEGTPLVADGSRVVLTPTGRLLANEATARLLGARSPG